MKKKILSVIMSSFMLFSMFTTGYNYKVQAITSDDNNYNQYETGLIPEDKAGQEWLDQNLVKVDSEEKVYEVLNNNSRSPKKVPKAASQSEEIPSSVDNSKNKYFPPIVGQNGNSCVSYSIGYYLMTYEYNKYHNTSADCEENLMSPRWCYNLTNDGNSSGSSVSSVLSLLKRNGAASIKDVPRSYSGMMPENFHYDYFARDNIWENALKNRISESYSVEIGKLGEDTPIKSPNDSNLNILKSVLAKGEILSFSTYISSFVYNTINEGYDHAGETIVTSCEGEYGYHEMTIVGYDDNIWVDIDNDNEVDEGEMGAIKIANSWGKGYKNSGFVWVAYDALNYKSAVLSDYSSSRIGVIEDYITYGIKISDTANDDDLYLELDLNTELRNTVAITCYTGDEENITMLKPIFDNRGGKHGYDGTTNASDGKFVIDLSRYNDTFTREKILKDGIKVNIDDTKIDGVYLTVKDVALIDKSNNSRTSLLDKSVKLDGKGIEVESKVSEVKSPTNFQVNINKDHHGELSWDKASDDISYYKIYRDNSLIGSTEDTTFLDEKDLNGEYTYSVKAIDKEGKTSQRVEKKVNNTYCKIYYKNNNYSSAYIHFRINNGNWTTVPGKEMNKSTSKDGYFEYIVDMSEYPEKSKVEACFNNGKNSWDNNNGSNYLFDKGSNTLENGKINKENSQLKIDSIQVSKTSLKVGEAIKIYTDVSGGSGEYNYTFNINKKVDTSIFINSSYYIWEPTEAGEYTISCRVSDKITHESVSSEEIKCIVKNKEDFKITGINFEKKSPQLRNTNILFNINTNADNLDDNISCDIYVIIPDGGKRYVFRDYTEESKYKFTETRLIGTYTFYATIKNNTTGEEDNITFNYEIKEGQLSISSFKAQQNYSNDYEDLNEIKASESYWLRTAAVGGVGNYSYQYGYYLNNKYYKIDNANWESYYPNLEKPGEYKFEVIVKDEAGNSTKAYKKLKITQGDLIIDYPEMDKREVEINGIINFKFKSRHNVDKVKYKVIDNYSGQSEVIQDFSYSDTLKYKATKGGYHYLTIEGKDSREIVKTCNLSFNVKTDPITIDTFKTNKSTIELGEEFNFEIKLSGGYGEKKYSLVAIDEDNNYEYFKENSNNEEIKWKPSKAGNYKIEINCYDNAGNYANKTIEVTVTKPAKLTTTTIYYKGYDNPYIHYRIGNGAWTKAPGIKMDKNSDIEGYNYAITIDLGDEDTLEACFNDGKGNWDSNGGKNYKFNTGYYTYSNGVSTEIEKPNKQFKINSIDSKLGSLYVSGNQNIFTVKSSNGEGKVEYRFEYKNNTTGDSGVLRDYSEYNTLSTLLSTPGKYTLTVQAKDSVGNEDRKTLEFEIQEYKNLEISSITSTYGDLFEAGSTTELIINTTGGKGQNYYDLEVNGKSIMTDKTSNKVSWTPTEAGIYEITAYAREAEGGYVTYKYFLTIREKLRNGTVIYYKGYENPYIHYKIGNGNWTNAPGIKMEKTSEKEGYDYKIIIDLGYEDKLTACFNDGNGHWDSDGGRNYEFGIGYYTYSNGKVNKTTK